MNDITQLKREGIRAASNVRNLMKAWNMSAKELAKATGVRKATVELIENKHRGNLLYLPALRTITRIADYVGVSVNDFIRTRIDYEKSQ